MLKPPRPHLSLRKKIRKLDDIEAIFLRRVRRHTLQLVNLIVQQAGESGHTESVIIPGALRRRISEPLLDMMLAARQAGAFDGLRDIARAQARVSRGAQFDIGQPSPESIPYEGIDWYQTHSLEITDVYEQSVLRHAQDIIIASRIEGLSIPETALELMDALPGFAWHRLENIARTESAKIYEQGKFIIYKETPGVAAYQIHAIIDARTTDICLARNGRILPMTAAAYEWPPYHYQCRTTVAAVLDVELQDGDVQLDPIPEGAPRPMAGFGTVLVPDGWKAKEYV